MNPLLTMTPTRSFLSRAEQLALPLARGLCGAALLALAAGLAACASAPSSEAPGPAGLSTGVQPQAARITDERILADRKTIDALQLRLRALNESGITQNDYPLAKAQCWLDTAKTQYHENDRTGYIEESLTESAKIIKSLETDKTIKTGFDTPLVARSTRLRDDLWMRLGSFKANTDTLACNAKTVACAEVRLVRAGHAEQQTGWRAATPHVQMVEDAMRKATEEAASCQSSLMARAALAPVPSMPAPAGVTVTQVITKETFVLLADTLFKFDKSTQGDMLPGGIQRLDTVAARLKTYQSIQNLTILGHTDRLGSDEYNDPLSQRRASTVNDYLSGAGVKAVKSEAMGKGKREPVTKDCSDKLPREQLIVCLQPDRRVTIEVTGVAK
jgi:outer membrane protein OmpA-like peptidoglycan-associated protein